MERLVLAFYGWKKTIISEVSHHSTGELTIIILLWIVDSSEYQGERDSVFLLYEEVYAHL